jgi:hypothetical protein
MLGYPVQVLQKNDVFWQRVLSMPVQITRYFPVDCFFLRGIECSVPVDFMLQIPVGITVEQAGTAATAVKE